MTRRSAVGGLKTFLIQELGAAGGSAWQVGGALAVGVALDEEWSVSAKMPSHLGLANHSPSLRRLILCESSSRTAGRTIVTGTLGAVVAGKRFCNLLP